MEAFEEFSFARLLQLFYALLWALQSTLFLLFKRVPPFCRRVIDKCCKKRNHKSIENAIEMRTQSALSIPLLDADAQSDTTTGEETTVFGASNPLVRSTDIEANHVATPTPLFFTPPFYRQNPRTDWATRYPSRQAARAPLKIGTDLVVESLTNMALFMLFFNIIRVVYAEGPANPMEDATRIRSIILTGASLGILNGILRTLNRLGAQCNSLTAKEKGDGTFEVYYGDLTRELDFITKFIETFLLAQSTRELNGQPTHQQSFAIALAAMLLTSVRPLLGAMAQQPIPKSLQEIFKKIPNVLVDIPLVNYGKKSIHKLSGLLHDAITSVLVAFKITGAATVLNAVIGNTVALVFNLDSPWSLSPAVMEILAPILGGTVASTELITSYVRPHHYITDGLGWLDYFRVTLQYLSEKGLMAFSIGNGIIQFYAAATGALIAVPISIVWAGLVTGDLVSIFLAQRATKDIMLAFSTVLEERYIPRGLTISRDSLESYTVTERSPITGEHPIIRSRLASSPTEGNAEELFFDFEANTNNPDHFVLALRSGNPGLIPMLWVGGCLQKLATRRWSTKALGTAIACMRTLLCCGSSRHPTDSERVWETYGKLTTWEWLNPEDQDLTTNVNLPQNPLFEEINTCLKNIALKWKTYLTTSSHANSLISPLKKEPRQEYLRVICQKIIEKLILEPRAIPSMDSKLYTEVLCLYKALKSDNLQNIAQLLLSLREAKKNQTIPPYFLLRIIEDVAIDTLVEFLTSENVSSPHFFDNSITEDHIQAYQQLDRSYPNNPDVLNRERRLFLVDLFWELVTKKAGKNFTLSPFLTTFWGHLPTVKKSMENQEDRGSPSLSL